MGAPHTIILFDGVCNLCNASVNWLIDRDPQDRFRFAALQSEAGKRVLREHGISDNYFDSLVVIHNGDVRYRSDGALLLAQQVGGIWKPLSFFRIIPRPLRDLVYNIIAKSRYRVFGRKNSCRMTTDADRNRFLQ